MRRAEASPSGAAADMQKIKQKQTTSSCAVTDAGAGVEAEAETETKRSFQLMALEMPKGAGHVALSFSLESRTCSGIRHDSDVTG